MKGKIEPQHLDRSAYVYIRQSSHRQVEEHLESQDLQYQLAQRAQALGWQEDQVVVIDDDLGKSAVTATGREGFQSLVAAVGLGQVGIVLVTDVSRLARNCSDWYQLLDLASLYDTLVSDAGGIYHPRIYDDRLLLGLKGTFSEAQWYSMRAQLQAARLNKARRGELAIRLPVGYDRLANGEVVLTPDQEVQSAIQRVLTQFERLGTARAVLRDLRDRKLELPRRVPSGPAEGEIAWVRPAYQIIYHILKNPTYAGAYAFGKSHSVRVPGAEGKVVTRSRPMTEWQVLIQDAFPAYITWEQYLENQKQLEKNAWGTRWIQGAPRQGDALLSGIVFCGRCGRAMRSRYRDKPAYVCEVVSREYGESRCQHVPVPHVDEAVTQIFLEAIRPAQLEVALAAVEEVEAQRQQMIERWQQRRERARYEANLARRCYDQVDPDNRLVAGELERRWEEKLQVQQQLEQEWAQAQAQNLAPLSEADLQLIRDLAEDLPALWYAETTTQAERKRLLRCLIRDVTLDRFSKPGITTILIHWHTDTSTTLEVPSPRPGCRTPTAVLERIRELAQHLPDDQVAAILNEEGVRSATGKTWHHALVRQVRKRHNIPSACPYITPESGPRGDGLITAAEAAERLDVTLSMVADWFRRGLLAGHQRRPGTPLWIRLTDEDVGRLDGSASRQSDMVPLRKAANALGMTAEEMQTKIRAGRLSTYRLRVGEQWRWFVRVPVEQGTRNL